MCFPYDSTPPIRPISGSAISSTNLILTSEDGTKFLAYHAMSDKSGGAGVIVLPDVRGIFGFYKDLADRLAEQGFDAVTIDYFGRTAGTGERPEEFDFMPHVEQTKVPNIAADAGAAAAVLRSGDGNNDRPLFTVGFCFGGSNSWILAGAGIGLSGAVGFYGHPTRLGRDGSAPAIDRIDSFRRPSAWSNGRRGSGYPRRGGREVRSGPGPRRDGTRYTRVPGRSALIFRPPFRGVRRHVRGRLEPRAWVHQRAFGLGAKSHGHTVGI